MANKTGKHNKPNNKHKQTAPKQPVRLFVQTIKTLHGRKHAVVDANNVIQNYGRGVAVFDHTKQGLALAREARKALQVA